MYRVTGPLLMIFLAITLPVVWAAFLLNISPYMCPDWLNQLTSYLVFADCMLALSWSISKLLEGGN